MSEIQKNQGAPKTLYIIVPCYNEEKVLPVTAPLFLEELKLLVSKELISDQSRIMFVNDGSSDTTWNIISGLAEKDSHFCGISQSRNRGHQNAVLAGLMEAKSKCDITISIDCDGQDDISVMEEMVTEYYGGAEIVYGVRRQRKTDTFFKRFTAETFYRLMNWMGAEVVFNHADYRLVSSKVLDCLADFEEVNIFLRGMIPLVGFHSTSVYYDRKARLAGKSHYSLKKMFLLAFDGITSLSVKPIRIITGLGIGVSSISFFAVIWALSARFFGSTVSGWTSSICIICFLSGIQLISLGVIGEYIGKIYLETKRRPRYIINERVPDDSDTKEETN